MKSRTILLIYSALAIIFTWPLVLGIGRDVPGDLGDSLLNMWILGWGVKHVPLLLTGVYEVVSLGYPLAALLVFVGRKPAKLWDAG